MEVLKLYSPPIELARTLRQRKLKLIRLIPKTDRETREEYSIVYVVPDVSHTNDK